MNFPAPDRFGDRLHAGELRAQIVTGANQGGASEAKWAAGLFDQPQSLAINMGTEMDQARSLASCDAVLVCASDAQSLKVLIEKVQSSAPGPAIFAVCNDLAPSQQAFVLGWGAEDVLNTAMDACEAAARIRATCRRIAQMRASRTTHIG